MAMAASSFVSNFTAAESNDNNWHDVFINHRGPDVKKTFASHLYRRLISYGLRVFLDFQELEEGKNFTYQIEGAIRNASVHVAVFSPRYAESNWCLMELLLMLESGVPIIPVFYHARPVDLRWTRGKNGVYADALRQLEMKKTHNCNPRYESSTIENWRNALSRVAAISGLDLEAFNGDEGALLDKVVEVVLKKVMKTQLNVARYPTGLDEKVRDFEAKVLLPQHSGRVQVVGITGLGGVGKTTLAKELFNMKSSNYRKSCFLFDIRENAKNSLHYLQSKLLKGLLQLDLHIDNSHEGIQILRKHLSSSQVLVVLDDVDDVDQVDALLPVDVLHHDSLILITCRDKNILARSGVQESSIYKLTGLKRERSRELFCSHAFSQPHPLSGFEYLVDKFLRACQGLPLSLKVFGALLYGNNDKSFWEGHLDRLSKQLPNEIQKSLQISYDALQKEEKQMFLDIACFFLGQNCGTAIRIWNASGWNGSLGFQSLLNKCLVEVDNGNNISMHEHLRNLGRDLAKDSSPCRLWCRTKNIDHLLQQSCEATEVRGIRMLPWEYRDDAEYASSDDSSDDDGGCTSFSRHKMKKLQLLDIGIGEDLLKCILSGVDSSKLIWLRWNNCPCPFLPSFIPMKKLRVLEVQGEALKTLWEDELQAPLQLRELRVGAPLSKIPKSIGQLKHLERMVITSWSIFDLTSWSGTIVEIPEEFCNLRSLKHLQLNHFSGQRSLPDSFGNLTNLEHIDLSGCRKLEMLPNSFGNLLQLKYLDLRACSSLSLSSGTFGNISTLEYIDLTGCNKIEVLPSQVAHQRSLQKLNLNLRNLKEWSSAIGEPSGLESLVLKAPLLEMLPPSLGRDLKNLKNLELRCCRSLKRFPDSVRMLNQLTGLTVNGCSLQELPFKMVEVKNKTMTTESKAQRKCSNLDSSIGKCMVRLQQFHLCNTQILDEVSFGEGVCPYLKHLEIQDCNDLVAVGTLPNALIKLVLIGCSKLKKIKGLCGLAKLQTLHISWCEEVEELPGIETLVSLEELQVSECGKLKNIRGLEELTKLRKLDVCGCSMLEELPTVEHLRSLEELWVCSCLKLKNIRGLARLTQLRGLNVFGCTELEELSGFEHLCSLEELCTCCCVKLKSIKGLGQLTKLRILNVTNCSELETLEGVEHLNSLEQLYACECPKLQWGEEVVEQLRQKLEESMFGI